MKGAVVVMYDDKEGNNMTNDTSTNNSPYSSGTANGYGGQPLGYGSSAYSNNAYLESMYGNSSNNSNSVNNVNSVNNTNYSKNVEEDADDDIVFISNDDSGINEEAKGILDGFDVDEVKDGMNDAGNILKSLDFPTEKMSYTNNTTNVDVQPQAPAYNSSVKVDEPYTAQPQTQPSAYNSGIKVDEPYTVTPQPQTYKPVYDNGPQPQANIQNNGGAGSDFSNKIVVNAPYGGSSNANYQVSEVSKYSSTSGTMYESGSSESGNGTAAFSAPFKRDNSFGGGDVGGMDFGGDAIDMTAPNYGSSNRSFGSGQSNTKKSGGSSGSAITGFTGLLVYLAMIGIAGFLLYLYKLGNFDIMSLKNTYILVGGAIYAVMLLDGLVMSVSNRDATLIIFALILPIFYPVKRCYTTYGRKNLHWLWLLLVFVLGGFVFTNIYPQVREEMLLIKNSADEYPSECDDAVRYLKDIRVNSDEAFKAGIRSDKDKMIVEIVREVYDDYKFKAEKLSSNTYKVTVTGDTKVELKAENVSAYQLINDNTIIVFTISKNAEGSYVLSNNISVTIATNGGSREFGVSAFNEICQSDDK